MRSLHNLEGMSPARGRFIILIHGMRGLTIPFWMPLIYGPPRKRVEHTSCGWRRMMRQHGCPGSRALCLLASLEQVNSNNGGFVARNCNTQFNATKCTAKLAKTRIVQSWWTYWRIAHSTPRAEISSKLRIVTRFSKVFTSACLL